MLEGIRKNHHFLIPNGVTLEYQLSWGSSKLQIMRMIPSPLLPVSLSFFSYSPPSSPAEGSFPSLLHYALVLRLLIPFLPLSFLFVGRAAQDLPQRVVHLLLTAKLQIPFSILNSGSVACSSRGEFALLLAPAHPSLFYFLFILFALVIHTVCEG